MLNNVICVGVQFLFIHSSFGGHLDCFYFLAFINTALNIYVQVLCGHVFSFFLHIYPEVKIAGPCGTSLFNCQAIFQSGCTILRSPQQCVRVSASPPPHQHLLLSFYCSHSSGFEVVSHFPNN